ncbi:MULTISPECIES: MerR family transcriptional regulator [Rhodococcus]|uniref:MerR family transcriptional regulator n=2 Tax=Nocardiaceae TaxID=85025 RepID=UPI00036E199B|nr:MULTISPECIES: MerR family transcriptional regulator [Rhodococcus]OQM78741.1 putative heat shock protein HspR [Rhodococcus sp. 66b]KDQ00639.1 MerR family transcriptional regulator [Rhodococcus qingshengii]MCZ4548227.1 MerR family transcriptional regulator [Rhodococcus qingshengii]MCZ4618719.1 MerR family transcriptional regulator [Rhodococcus qingshengii]MDI9960718.1 MerR family transcriptional regulator [Rhodococcus sp. IEGM 1237]
MKDPAHAHRGVYGISVMSELSGVGPQTLRLYERRGLLTPARTSGGTRRYSAADLDKLRRITALIGDGINLTGIGVILSLETENAILAERIAQLSETAVDTPPEVTPETVQPSSRV